MTPGKAREIIREDASELNARYRITRDGEVHYYGKSAEMTSARHWYFVAGSAEALAMQILRERHHAQMRKAGML